MVRIRYGVYSAKDDTNDSPKLPNYGRGVLHTRACRSASMRMRGDCKKQHRRQMVRYGVYRALKTSTRTHQNCRTMGEECTIGG
jgi:hypothetical protein